EDGARLHELAEGLGYWAARYQTLPGVRGQSGSLRVAEAIAGIPLVEGSRRKYGLFTESVKQIDDERFAPVIDLVDVGVDPSAFVSDVTRTLVRQCIAGTHT